MIIKGFQRTSLIDYPNNICSTVFLANCNFRCGFCYNKDLVLNSPELKEFSQEEILAELGRRKKYIDGVCITGGEPLLNPDLPEFIRKIRALDFLVKVDTNGSFPKMLDELTGDKLVDYIAMDVKSSLEKYPKVTGVPVDPQKIRESAKIIMRSGVPYEFRTTVVPTLVEEEDVRKIGEWLAGGKQYYLQQFRPITSLDPVFSKKVPYSKETILWFQKVAQEYFEKVGVRGIS